jgi:hypothetical protein
MRDLLDILEQPLGFDFTKNYTAENCNSTHAVECNTIRALYSSWMSACIMMIVYVLYNVCRFAFNCRYRDYLTMIIQILSILSLLSKDIVVTNNSEMRGGHTGSGAAAT